MIDNLDDFLTDYDQIAYEVQTARREFIEMRLARFFAFLNDEDDNIRSHIEYLRKRFPLDEINRSVLIEREGMGDDIIKMPSGQLDQLSVYLNIFGAMSTQAIRAETFAIQYFRGSERSLEVINRNMTDGFFAPFASELKRYIKKNYDEDPPISDQAAEVPASDRSVKINHNSTEYVQAEAEIAELIELLRSTNDYGEPDDRAQRLAELEAGKTILNAPEARVSVLRAIFEYCLTAIAKKFADNVAGAIAKRILAFIDWLINLLS